MGRLVALGLFERAEDQTFVLTKEFREVEIDRALRSGNCGTTVKRRPGSDQIKAGRMKPVKLKILGNFPCSTIPLLLTSMISRYILRHSTTSYKQEGVYVGSQKRMDHPQG